MTIKLITRKYAVQITGFNLPSGYRWYQVVGIEFYPTYGDWSQVWAVDSTLQAVIGKRKSEVKAVAA